jgi:hypothetical protein
MPILWYLICLLSALKDDKMYIRDSEGVEHSAEKIYKEFLTCVVKNAKDEINRDSTISTIQFIFTVPDHWETKKISLIKKITQEVWSQFQHSH